ncbi:MAG: iron-sulfur cluster assembly accessory protein, partial [Myxococcota bacterium]|nr:iron-sulfur cluster assembly accessory protein [Myxococcota bacterium]
MAATVEVTQNAADKISSLFSQKKLSEEVGLRIGVQGGGCSGLSYNLSIDDEPTKFDRVFESNGVLLIVDKKSFLYTAGLILDFDTD